MSMETTKLRNLKSETFGTFPRAPRTRSKVRTTRSSCPKLKANLTAGLADENEYLLVFDDGEYNQIITNIAFC